MGILHRKRLWALACVFACIIAGVPYWWKATEISRPPLPHDEIARVAAAHAAQIPRHRLHVELVVVQGGGGRLDSSSAEDAALLLEDATCAAMESSGFSSGAVCQEEVELEVKVVSTAEECADVGLHCEGLAREACAGELESAVEAIPWAYVESSPMRFRILAVLCSAPPGSRSSAVLVSAGRLGLAVVTGTAASAAVQRRVASAAAATAAAVFAGDTVRRFRAMRHGTSGNPAWGGMPISAAGQVALSFSLCNGDVAGGGVVLWDFQRWHSRYLQPMLEELAPITNVTVDSQVLFQTPSRERGAWSEQHRAFVLKQQQLPFFLDNEWPLDSGRALSSPSAAQHEDSSAAVAAAAIPSPVLHWVVYVPAPAQQPLRIQGADASRLLPSDAFEIPTWGGVILLNLDPLANQTDRRYRPRQLLVPEADAARVMQVVRAQLRSLNGLPESSEQYSDHLGAIHLPLHGTDLDVHVKFQDPGRSGRLLAGWELDALLRERAACNLASAVASLSSLSQVVQDLANLAIPDAVGSYVDEALSKIQAAQAALAASQLLQAAALAQEAAALAELAFSHSSILAQLNVPDVQKLAVYMPFFVPAALPLLRHLLRELALLRWTLPSRSRP